MPNDIEALKARLREAMGAKQMPNEGQFLEQCLKLVGIFDAQQDRIRELETERDTIAEYVRLDLHNNDLASLRAENERLTRVNTGLQDEARIWRETAEGNSEIISREHARALAAEARAEKAVEDMQRLTGALRVIAGLDPCIDNLMGNRDIALAALASLPKENSE